MLADITSNVTYQLCSVQCSRSLLVIYGTKVSFLYYKSGLCVIDFRLLYFVILTICVNMAECAKCLKSIARTGKNATRIDCVECKSCFHGNCVNLTPEDIKYYQDNETIWRCEACSKERRKSMALESCPTSKMTYDDVFNLVTQLRKDIKDTEANLGRSLNSAFDEIKETKALVSKQSEDITGLISLVNKLATENTELKSKVSFLESRMDDIEQYSRRDTFEIHGVPVERGEQIVEVVKTVGKALDMNIDENMISACHRLRTREGMGKPPGIIVKMTRRMDVEAVLQKRRVKRNFSTHHIGLTSSPAAPIYINESLCPGRRRLLNAAREKKNEKLYTYLWIRGGKILMRKADGDPVKVVTSQMDLDKL